MMTLKKLVATGAAATVLIGATCQVHALTLAFGDAYSLGWYNPPEPASPTAEASYITTLIAQTAPSGPTLVSGFYYTRTANTFGVLPAATAIGSVKNESGTATGINGTGYTYLIGKYDGPNGAGYVWYIGALTGPFDIPSTIAGSGLDHPTAKDKNGNPVALKGGLSHWSLYNPSVPDGGATLLLLGSALSALGFASRKRRKA